MKPRAAVKKPCRSSLVDLNEIPDLKKRLATDEAYHAYLKNIRLIYGES